MANAAKIKANIARMPVDHRYSMSFKVTALNGEIATKEGRDKAIEWLRANGIGKVWLETYRHNEYVTAAQLVEQRYAFEAAGFEVAGLITYTMLNDPPEVGAERSFVCCWTDPVARARCRAEAERAAKIFDTLLLDDFMFSTCTCPRCIKAKDDGHFADWGAARRALITDVLVNLIMKPAQAVNPNVKVIVKYQCWFDGWFDSGDDPSVQTAALGSCWIGTETRDICPDALKACWINDFIAALTDDHCIGAWFDPLDCSPAKYLEQARYTILGGARESLVHAWDYLVADNPGIVPFGQSPKNGHACRVPFEREIANLRALSVRLAGAQRGNYSMIDGVSTHEFFKDGKKTVVTMDTHNGTIVVREMPGHFVAPSIDDYRSAMISDVIADRQHRDDFEFLSNTMNDPSRAFNLLDKGNGIKVLEPKLPVIAMDMLVWSMRRDTVK